MSKSILVVDDDADIREIIVTYIKDLYKDAKIVEAQDGSIALTKMVNQKFNLLITDLKMNKLDGKGLMQSIAGLDKSLRPEYILVVSGYLDGQEKAKKIGNTYFVQKPFDESTFKEVLTKVFSEKETHKKTFKVDVNFINPFIEGALNVIEVNAGITATKEEMYIREPHQVSGDISAVISMNSNDFLGSMAISFEKQCFLEIVSNMLGTKYDAINEENQDAVAELCNQIFGAAKTVLNQQGHSIAKAIPSVIVGDKHLIRHLINGPCIAVKFATPYGKFSVEAIIQGQ